MHAKRSPQRAWRASALYAAVLAGCTLALQAQALQNAAAQNGTISGIVRGNDGGPVRGVRVSAIPEAGRQEQTTEMVSIAETDDRGRFVLERVPPGRYLIAAGRLDRVTYYPGFIDAAGATPLLVAAGSLLTGIDFRLDEASSGRAGLGALQGTVFTLDVRVEGPNPRIPTFYGNERLSLRFSGTTRTDIPLMIGAVPASLPFEPLRVTVENLAPAYVVKSITKGAVDLMTQTLAPGILATPNTVPIVVVLAPAPSGIPGSVVRGELGIDVRPVFLSGRPGVVFSDATFEFHGVPAGVHLAVTSPKNPGALSPLGAHVLVGETGIVQAVLEEVAVLPKDSTLPREGIAGSDEKNALPLRAIRGRVVDAETKAPVPSATVFIRGDSWAYFVGDDEGRFEIPRLLRGTYDVEIRTFGHRPVLNTVTVAEQDVMLEIAVP